MPSRRVDHEAMAVLQRDFLPNIRHRMTATLWTLGAVQPINPRQNDAFPISRKNERIAGVVAGRSSSPNLAER